MDSETKRIFLTRHRITLCTGNSLLVSECSEARTSEGTNREQTVRFYCGLDVFVEERPYWSRVIPRQDRGKLAMDVKKVAHKLREAKEIIGK
ncbi:MAG: hypothetical protein MUO84_02820 [Thermoplasmata archaeon]|nr:hypothetical protein [Thermoplasmata archaeon]